MTNAFGDEANIAYVGFTRAIRELHLPRDFKTILTPGWQEAIERYEPVQVSRTSKGSPMPRKRAPRPSLSGKRYAQSTIETDLPKPPRKKPFKLGDRVRTAGHGTGKIIEVDGDKYLVALDGRTARLWDREWGLKRV